MRFALWTPLLTFILVGNFVLAFLAGSLKGVNKKAAQRHVLAHPPLFFYLPIHKALFGRTDIETLYFSTIYALNLTRFFYGALCTLFLFESLPELTYPLLSGLLAFFLLFSALFVTGEILPRIAAQSHNPPLLKFRDFFASCFLLVILPFSLPFFKLFPTKRAKKLYEPQEPAKQEMIDIIREANVSGGLDPDEKKLIESVVSFRDHIVRDVMVPRIDLQSFPKTTTIQKAAKQLKETGYSRAPVYDEDLDNVIGILLYKDLLDKYMEASAKQDPSLLKETIESIVRPALYAPETKKVSHLMQELRNKQLHLAIIVDEYGATEGIVTLEDILEEIVGEIEDEYDEEEVTFTALSDGWIADARMTIAEAEEKLHITIPQEENYDTIGGYIFHRSGGIPTKGFHIRTDLFDLEVISSDERRIKKVRIKPIRKKEKKNGEEGAHD